MKAYTTAVVIQIYVDMNRTLRRQLRQYYITYGWYRNNRTKNISQTLFLVNKWETGRLTIGEDEMYEQKNKIWKWWDVGMNSHYIQ